MPLEKIKFQTNVNVELALKFAEGKLCDSQFGDPQYMFTTTDGRVFFVAEKVAQKIHGLRPAVGELLDVCKAEVDYGNGRKGIEWKIARVGITPGEQPDGTFAVPAGPPPRPAGNGPSNIPAASIQPASHAPLINGHGSKPVNGNGNGHAAAPALAAAAAAAAGSEGGPALMPWALFLLAQTNQLTEVYARACLYASNEWGNQVRNEDVKSFLVTAFINRAKNGGTCDIA